MALSTPKVKNGQLTLEKTGLSIALDTPEWYKWLAQSYSFSYESAGTTFTLHRRDHGSCQYWYAYRRKEGRLKTLYAGKTGDLSRARLEEIVLKFEGKDRPDQENFPQTRFFLPLGPTALVTRSRLLERLDTAARYKLILVTAPPGYGKTTLLAEWARTGKKPVAWLSLDEEGIDPARFSAYLTEVLAPFLPTIAGDKVNLVAAMAGIAEAGMRLTTDTFLVLDDFHLIQAGRILEEIASLLTHLPPRLHLIISSRSLPAVPLGKLRAKGQVLEIKTGDLCFTVEETQEFFNLTSEPDLSREQVRRLWEQSEGWVTAIRLAALSLQDLDGQRIKDFIHTFRGDQPYVFEYLGEEVLSRQPEEMQRFLLDSSILSRLNAGLCEYVTGQTGGQEKLARLEKDNLLIVPFDSHREWYRYHHLFAQFLQTRLEQSTANLAELHRRAASWYEQRNMVEEAIKHHFAAGDFEQASRLVAASGRKLLGRGEVTTLKSWLETIPAALVIKNPELDLLYTWVLALEGQLIAAEERFLRVEKSLPPGEAQALRLMLVLQKGDIEEVYRLGSPAYDNPGEPDSFIRSVQALATGLIQRFFGDSVGANRAYLTSSLLGQAAGNTFLVQVATAKVADMLFLQGQLHRAAETYRRVLDPSRPEENSENGLKATTLVYQGYSLVLYEWNRLEEAAVLLESAIRLNSSFAYHLIAGTCLAQLAQVREALGDRQGAQEAIIQATETLHRSGPDWLAGYAGTILAWVNLRLGNLGDVRDWTKVFPPQLKETGELTPFMSYMRMSQAVCAKLCLLEGKVAQALEILEQLEPEAVRQNWVKWLLEIKTLRAAALLAAGKERAALSKLKEALVAGAKEGFIRSIADHSDLVGNILVKASENLDPAYRHKLLEACGKTGNPTVILSIREQAVLKLAAGGMTNEEIARELTVGTSTVKTHLLHIYSKLAVHNRNQATVRARELELI